MKVQPENPDVLINVGAMYYHSKDYTNAEIYFKKAHSAKDDFYPNYYLGCLYYDLEKWAEAKQHLNKCIDQRPDFAAAHYALGSIEIYLGNEQAAVTAFKTTLSIAPHYYTHVESLKEYYPALNNHEFSD